MGSVSRLLSLLIEVKLHNWEFWRKAPQYPVSRHAKDQANGRHGQVSSEPQGVTSAPLREWVAAPWLKSLVGDFSWNIWGVQDCVIAI